MPKQYRVYMTETRSYETTYTVEAESVEEAEKKAWDGETVEETEGKLKEVLNREIWGAPTEVLPSTDVFSLDKGEFVANYSLTPERAVVAAERQLIHKDFDTWDYEKYTAQEGVHCWFYGEHPNIFGAKKK